MTTPDTSPAAVEQLIAEVRHRTSGQSCGHLHDDGGDCDLADMAPEDLCHRCLSNLSQSLLRALLAERDALRAALKAASDELWATYYDIPRVRPLFDQIQKALEPPS